MRAISIAVELLFPSKVLIVNKSKDTHHKYHLLHTLQSKVAGLCANNSINKDEK